MGAPIHPQFPAQPNSNPNNKTMQHQQFKISSMLVYSISPLPCNNLHLRSRRVVEPIFIEDVPSYMIDEGMNPQFGNSFNSVIPIIEYVETPAKMPIEIHDKTTTETLAETHTKTQVTLSSREPPYLERLTLQNVMEQPSFNLLGELKNIYLRIPLLQSLHDVPI